MNIETSATPNNALFEENARSSLNADDEMIHVQNQDKVTINASSGSNNTSGIGTIPRPLLCSTPSFDNSQCYDYPCFLVLPSSYISLAYTSMNMRWYCLQDENSLYLSCVYLSLSKQAQMEVANQFQMEIGYSTPYVDETFNNLPEIVSSDTLLRLRSTPSSFDKALPYYYPCSPVLPTSYVPLAYTPMNIETSATPNNALIEENARSSLNGDDEMIHVQNQDRVRVNANSGANNRSGNRDLVFTSGDLNVVIETISSPLLCSRVERMMRVLSLFKPTAGEGTLVQLWMPIKIVNLHILVTNDQPNMYDQVLADYRQISRRFSFLARDQGSVLGLSGWVFTSGRPEWTSSVAHYSRREHLRVHHAIRNEVRGSLAMPIFIPDNTCVVFEVVRNENSLYCASECEPDGYYRAVQPKYIYIYI